MFNLNQPKKMTYRANAGELRLWAQIVDDLGLAHNNVVILYGTEKNLMPYIPVPGADSRVAEYNAKMEETVAKLNGEDKSPVQDILDEIEAE